jgi:hypothetical protein
MHSAPEGALRRRMPCRWNLGRLACRAIAFAVFPRISKSKNSLHAQYASEGVGGIGPNWGSLVEIFDLGKSISGHAGFGSGGMFWAPGSILGACLICARRSARMFAIELIIRHSGSRLEIITQGFNTTKTHEPRSALTLEDPDALSYPDREKCVSVCSRARASARESERQRRALAALPTFYCCLLPPPPVMWRAI